VLVLGGGDGLALREILKYPNIKAVTLVDLDAEMTRLFSTSAPLVALNRGAFADPRVTVVNEDAARWLENATQSFDVVIADFPDPSNFALGKLYSVPFYRLLARHVAANGYMVVQSTSPYFAPQAFWCIDATLREAGLRTWPYHAYVPSFGEWGFILASTQGAFAPPQHYRMAMRFLDAEVTRGMFAFAPDMPHPAVEPNRLNTQSLVHYFEDDWHRVIR
jgi:spermidine synthase